MVLKNAARKVVTRSPKRKVGLINCRWFQSHPIEHESQLEKRFVYCTLLCPQVVQIESQPFTLEIGKKSYTPDFLVKFSNGQALVVEVKVNHRVDKYLELFNGVKKILSLRHFPFFVLTQNEIDRLEQPRVAAEILRYGKSEFTAATLQTILDAMSGCKTTCLSIGTLVERSGACREAVLHLIARRKLTLHEDDFIHEDARVFMRSGVRGPPINAFIHHFEVTPWTDRSAADDNPPREKRGHLRKRAGRSAMPYLRLSAPVPNHSTAHALADIAGGLPRVVRRRRPGSSH
jgi:uncharacterized protein YlzI (FlbEa/FlbD family)